MKRPNIIFAFSDQQHYDSFNADPKGVCLPGIRRLASEGISFPNAYATNPICGPSRSSIFTGRMPSELGTSFNGVGFQVPVELISERLNGAGYRSYYAGKWHVGHCMAYDIPGFEVLCTGSNCNGNFSDPAITATVEGFLRNYKSEEPFFLAVSWQQPHDTCGWKHFQDAGQEDLPYKWLEKDYPAAPVNLKHFDRDEPEAIKEFRRGVPPSRDGWDEAAWRYYRWAYDRQIEMVDAELERLLLVLDEAGLRDSTAVVYTTDHGEGAGNHGLTDKAFLYEESVRTPVIVSCPGMQGAGTATEALASGLDIFPTICDIAGADIPQGLRGCSLLASGTGEREYVCSEGSHVAAARMVRSSRYKYIWYEDSNDEQLFDLIDDPFEQNNLAYMTAVGGELMQHRRWLREWGSCTSQVTKMNRATVPSMQKSRGPDGQRKEMDVCAR